MLLAIVLITIFIGVLFLVALISLIIFIYNVVRKNSDLQKKSLKILIPSAILWVLLIGVDIFLTINYLSNNGREIVDKTLEISSEIVSRSLVSTLQNFEKNWDKGRLEQLKNLSISLSSIDYETKDGIKDYTIEIIFDNNSPTEVKLYFVDLLGNNYLVACDKEDFAYPLRLKDEWDENIPFGKSRYNFTVDVSEGIEIDHIRYVTENIMLN